MTFEFDGKTYRWERNESEGNWITEDHRYAHLSLQGEISKAAREAGLSEAHNFVHYTPKPEKRKPVSLGGSKPKVTSAIRIRIPLLA